ncbi:MAG: HTH domain-containing protein, partial [Alistipes sp.]|nr:HTH domain-containing protein [Alistipes sp.]
MDQPKIERLLRLMKLLTANTTYTVDQLAERLDMSRRTIYRYIDTFRDAGFVIKKSGDCIRLDKASPHFKDISQLVHFTEEEAVILKSAIESIDDTNLLKQNLKKKLYAVYDNKTLADTVVKGKNAPNIRNLIEAIEEQQQVILKGYQSAHGSAVRDRRVEPFAFTT